MQLCLKSTHGGSQTRSSLKVTAPRRLAGLIERRGKIVCRSQSQGLQSPALPPLDTVDDDKSWISSIIPFWLNEEWTELSVHDDLGIAAGDAYATARLHEGCEDMGDLVLSMSSLLGTFDYTETFVNNFEVGNKVVELLMMRSGVDVCCVDSDGQTLIERHEKSTRP